MIDGVPWYGTDEDLKKELEDKLYKPGNKMRFGERICDHKWEIVQTEYEAVVSGETIKPSEILVLTMACLQCNKYEYRKLERL